MSIRNCIKLIAGVSVAGVLCFALPAFAADEPGPTGLWVLGKEKIRVRISYCDGEKLCAVIAGLRKPLDAAGNPKVDKNNPNPNLRSRPLMGLEVISGMKPAGDNAWKGSIYNADDGSTYRAEARLDGNKFLVKGCWGPFCKKMNFVRVKAVASN
jgi:uncharacterized protein (DUF2147 family)